MYYEINISIKKSLDIKEERYLESDFEEYQDYSMNIYNDLTCISFKLKSSDSIKEIAKNMIEFITFKIEKEIEVTIYDLDNIPSYSYNYDEVKNEIREIL